MTAPRGTIRVFKDDCFRRRRNAYTECASQFRPNSPKPTSFDFPGRVKFAQDMTYAPNGSTPSVRRSRTGFAVVSIVHATYLCFFTAARTAHEIKTDNAVTRRDDDNVVPHTRNAETPANTCVRVRAARVKTNALPVARPVFFCTLEARKSVFADRRVRGPEVHVYTVTPRLHDIVVRPTTAIATQPAPL